MSAKPTATTAANEKSRYPRGIGALSANYAMESICSSKIALTGFSRPWPKVRSLARERKQQLSQHRLRTVPTIVAKLKLPQILREMLRADVDVRPVDPALQLRPEAFHRAMNQAADEAFEKAARVAEHLRPTALSPQFYTPDIAAAIRALKGRP